jgi:hypothetical protein
MLVGLLYLVEELVKGLNGWIPVGSQIDPSSTVGDNLVWKNAKKNTDSFSIRKTSRLMLVTKIIAVYCEKHKIHINTQIDSIHMYLMLHNIFFYGTATKRGSWSPHSLGF